MSFPAICDVDQLLIQAMITTNPIYRSSEGWLPIRITDVRRNAFLHLYVGFVTDDVFVFFVTTATDPEVFSAYSQLKERIYNRLYLLLPRPENIDRMSYVTGLQLAG